MHLDAKRLNKSAVLNSTRAGCFATATVETQIEMMADLFRQIQSTVDNGSHQINAASRTVVFVAGFDIGGTGSRTKSTVHAVQKPIVRN